MSDRPAPHATSALLLGDAVGYSGPTSVPFWLVGVSAMFGLSPAQAGGLVTVELVCIALAAVAASRLVGRVAPRTAGLSAVALSVVGNLVAYLSDSVPMLAGALALTGVGLGTLLATCNVVAARRADPQRIMALMQLALVVFAMVFFLVAPRAVGPLGPKAAFALLAGFGLASLPFIAGLPARLERETALRAAGGARAIQPRVVAACLGLLLALGGQTCFWPFITQIGADVGFDPNTVGLVLSIGAVVNMAGPLAARLIGNRFGAALPLVAGFALLMAASALLGQSHSQAGFAIGSVALSTLTLFVVPNLLALLAMLDESGRMAGAGPAMLMIGSALAPAIAGAAVASGGFTALSHLTMAIFAIGLALCFYAAGGAAAGARKPA